MADNKTGKAIYGCFCTTRSEISNVVNYKISALYITKQGGRIMEHKFTAANFEKEVLDAEIPVLVDFYADWCGPCKMMAPIVTQLAEEYEGKLKVGKCNIDDEDGLARMYRVMSIPTMKIFVQGKDVATVVGAVPKEQLEAELKKVL